MCERVSYIYIYDIKPSSRPDFAMLLPFHVDTGADDSSDGQSWPGVDSDDSYYSDPPTSMTRCTRHLFIRLEELFEHTESPADHLAYTMELSERSGHHVLDNIVELLSWALQDREPPLPDAAVFRVREIETGLRPLLRRGTSMGLQT